MSSPLSDQRGFTLIELLIAMTVFSFMLLIISVGFINVVRIHNQALASNVAQDNARTAMDEIVRGVRNSKSVENWHAMPDASICLASSSGLEYEYFLSVNVLYKADGCAGTRANIRALTSSAVNVTDFTPAPDTNGPQLVEQSVSISLTVASANGTTSGSGSTVQCGSTTSDRTFCSVVTLKSGAVAR